MLLARVNPKRLESALLLTRSMHAPFSRWRPHPWHGLDPGPSPPSLVNVFVEITPFDLIKYEVEKGSGYLKVDRTQRTMNLGWMTMALPEADARAVVLHEFGHALGLVHEHMNPAQPIDWNKDKVREDMRASQGWSDDKIDANMFHRYGAGEIFGTDVDPTSIMMYPIPPGWTKNGFTVGFNTLLSAADKALIRKAYGVRPVFGG